MGRVLEEVFMKLITCVIAFAVFVLSGAQTKVSIAPALQPTPLEAFAGFSATHVAWSNEVGRLDSIEAHAVVTALILEDTAQPPDRMRGIRIDLRSRDSRDQVFLGEETLAVYKSALGEISQGAPRFRNEYAKAPGGLGYLGACVFWYGHNVPRVHTLSAAYYIAPDSSGLSLSAFKDAEFRFPGHDSSQLSAAIARAMDQLKQR